MWSRTGFENECVGLAQTARTEGMGVIIRDQKTDLAIAAAAPAGISVVILQTAALGPAAMASSDRMSAIMSDTRN